MSEHLPPLDLSGQNDDGDQTALTQAHLDEIASMQEPDPDPDATPVDSILEEDDR